VTTEIPIGKVVVRERSRKEMRNIAGLAESIKEIGLLHPPVVRQDGREYVLVAGQRRVEAMRQLGFDRIQVTVVRNLVSELSALRAEGEENTCREPFSPSEAVAHADRIEAVIAAKAKERQSATLKQNRGADSAPRTDAAPVLPKGKTRDQVAEAVGIGRTALTHARTVVDAAKDPSLPAEVRAVAEAAVESMDATGKIEPAYKAVEKAKADAAAKPLEQFLADDADVQLTTWRLNFAKALTPLTNIPTFPVADVLAKADAEQLDDLAAFIDGINSWWSAIDTGRQATTRLRVVGGAR
jgi:ParB family chromosome partitioning protein